MKHATDGGKSDKAVFTDEEVIKCRERYVNETALTAPVEKGQRVSTLQIWSGNVCVSQTELYAMNSVKVADSLSSQKDSGKGRMVGLQIVLYIFGGIFLFILLAIVMLYGVRTVRIAKANRQRRMHRRYRRRSR